MDTMLFCICHPDRAVYCFQIDELAQFLVPYEVRLF